MNAANILEFISELTKNNNREWFTAHKDWYEQSRQEFELICANFIQQVGVFDEEVRGLQPSDCIFRIYRDIRFSPDKTPYKNHFGAFFAKNGGRKSDRSGYYLHLQPGGNSLISCGIWCPPKELLTAVRQSIYDNIDEFLEIMEAPDFKKLYPQLWSFESLKKVPQGFPKDWEYSHYLKMKHYMVEHTLPDTLVAGEQFVNTVVEAAKISIPFNRFLNYTADEVL